jgi:hypothetical protein
VAEELTAKDVIRAHARDELGIDLDDMANPLQARAHHAGSPHESLRETLIAMPLRPHA